MFYTRGSADDYNRFAAVTGDKGWSWDNIQPFLARVRLVSYRVLSEVQSVYFQNERFEPPADRHNTSGQFNPLVHSFSGVNAVSLPGFPTNIDSMVFDAVNELGGIFHYNEDVNSGMPLGFGESVLYHISESIISSIIMSRHSLVLSPITHVFCCSGWLQKTVTSQGRRSSSATSYLAPEFISRPNLDVLLNARVARVLPNVSLTEHSTSGLAFRTVEFAHDLDGMSLIYLHKNSSLIAHMHTGPRQRVSAAKEVILSAGVIGSPQILLNSGIGNSTTLFDLGITPLVNLPSVGQNLTDQPSISNEFLVNTTQTFDDLKRNATLLNEVYTEFNKSGMGPLVDTGGNQISFFRVNESLTDIYGDPSSGKNSPHLEMVPGVSITLVWLFITSNMILSFEEQIFPHTSSYRPLSLNEHCGC